jgi:hypothetical protein
MIYSLIETFVMMFALEDQTRKVVEDVAILLDSIFLEK